MSCISYKVILRDNKNGPKSIVSKRSKVEDSSHTFQKATDVIRLSFWFGKNCLDEVI